MSQDKINEAITNYLSVLWTNESKSNIVSLFGSDIYSQISGIASFASNNFILSYDGENDLRSHSLTIDKLREEYPFLINASLIKIADCAAYFWKYDE